MANNNHKEQETDFNFMKININTNKNQKAFTLIEVLVATSLFVIVAVQGLTVLMNAQKVYKRISSNRIVMDNINLVLDTITRELKFGYEYGCVNSVSTIDVIAGQDTSFNRSNNTQYTTNISKSDFHNDITNTCDAVIFTPQDNKDKKVVFYFDRVEKSIRQISYDIDSGSNTFTPNSETDMRLTSKEFQIDSFWFKVRGISNTDTIQPRIEIYISGIVDSYLNIATGQTNKTSIFLQSSITQRILDN